jgi:hypothetical protein
MARSKRKSIIGIPPQDITDPNNSSGTSMLGVQNIQEHYQQSQEGRFDEVQEKYGATFVKDGLQVWYDANIASSWVQNDLNVYDVSGNSRNAIWNAGMGTDTHTGAGSVVHNIWKITNNTRYLTGPAANAVGLDGNSFTLGMTVYIDAAAQSVAFHFNRDASYTDSTDRALSLHMVWSDGRIYFDTHGDGTGYNRHTGDVNDHTYDTWQTIFFTADSNGTDSMTKSIYIDGSLASSSTSTTRVTLALGSLATEWFYGKTAYSSTYHPNWYSCVGLWNRALTSSEISTMHSLIDIS